MSYWTHIRGTVEVSVPGRTQPEIEYILNTVLEHLPLVTGSERDMKVYVVREDGYNMSSSHDEFGNKTNLGVSHYGSHSYRYGSYETQDMFMLVLEANLRDRFFEQTKKEFIKWLCRLAKRIMVENVLVNIWAYDESLLIKDFNDKFGLMYEYPSWSRANKDKTPSWCEYLLWERAPRCEMPMKLYRKYYEDSIIDEELERRENWMEEQDK